MAIWLRSGAFHAEEPLFAMVGKRENRLVMLLILDGWGYRSDTEGNAIALANTPSLDVIQMQYPGTCLATSGEAVGLPTGLMGNSEVGHLNLGAGRVVYQDLVRIDHAIRNGSFFENRVLRSAFDNARRPGRSLHLMGLLSDGGVHSSLNHLYALLDGARRHGVCRVFVHPFLDGRDTPPQNGKRYIEELEARMKEMGVGRIASVMGRYYAMDRDRRWDRTERAYRALVLGEGYEHGTATEAVLDSYFRGVTDEFVEPVVITDDNGAPVGPISAGDSVICFNFRGDRPRQLARALTQDDFDEFRRPRHLGLHFVCMTQYERDLNLPVAFPPSDIENGLGVVCANAGISNLRIAETEKYAHVTFFFNGGEEQPYPGEERVLIPSPQVATYDLRPEMSAPELTRRLVEAIKSQRHRLIIANYANPDMVGHTGHLEAAVKAIEVVDRGVGEVIDAVRQVGGVCLLTADHGNAELMIDSSDGGPHTAHTSNPVPCWLIDDETDDALRFGGKLADVAPTLLGLLGAEVPEEMTGRDLRIQAVSGHG